MLTDGDLKRIESGDWGLPDRAIQLLVDEVRRLRQGLWDVYAICGGDTDGDPTPVARVSDLLPLVIEYARELRADFENELAV